jgi:hypothetical protein
MLSFNLRQLNMLFNAVYVETTYRKMLTSDQ